MAKIIEIGGLLKMKSISIFDVAHWFLNKEPMTHKKLQKICYYTYAWYLTLYGKRLFNEYFEGWVHGPVNRALYNEYKIYGWTDIKGDNDKPQFDREIEEFLEIIYNNFSEYNGDELELMTHNEKPWIESRYNLSPEEPGYNRIKDSTITSYYSSLLEGAQID